MSSATMVEVPGPDGVVRDVRISSPDRVMWPDAGLTKLDLAHYTVAVADGLLRALGDRPVTLQRFPDGVDGQEFFSKNPPRGVPAWVRSVPVTYPSGRSHPQLVVDEVATAVWAVQMNTVTFHPWPVRSDDVDHPDELRIDLDPQPGTDFADAVRVAAEARTLLGDLGYTGFPKTSGGRGVHIYVRIEPRWSFTDVRHAAIAFGRELERRLPGQVTTSWWKEERGECIFVDYNQNARDRTIASAYSIRPRPGAPVSAPLAWDELNAVEPEDFTVATMPARFAEVGDRHAAIDDAHHSLQPLLDMYERDAAGGEADMPYPPDYPKMPGEPKR